MPALQLLKQPNEVAFSGNPVVYILNVAPYTDATAAQDVRVIIHIQVEDKYKSNTWQVVKSQTFFPNEKGLVQLDIAAVLDAYVDYYTPRLNYASPMKATGQYRRYKLTYLLQVDGEVVGGPTDTTPALVLKGGISYEQWDPVNFFAQTILGDRNFLSFAANREKTRVDEIRFLFMCVPVTNQNASLNKPSVVYRVTMSDNSIVTKSVVLQNVDKWEVLAIPAGFNQAGLDALVPSGLWPVKYSVEYNDPTTTKTDLGPYPFTLDHRNFYDARTLIYRNSCGGMDTITLLGQIDRQAEYERQQYSVASTPPYYTDTVLQHQMKNDFTEETEKFTGDTGFISKTAADKLRDLLLSRQVYECTTGKLKPVVMVNKSTKFYSNKDNLLSLSLEWSPAYSNNYYLPDGLVSPAASCPAMESLTLTRKDLRIVTVAYTLQHPYDYAQFTITTPAGTVTDKYFGNSNTFDIVLPDSTALPAVVSVNAQTICDELNNDLGPVMSDSITLSPDTLLAVDDYFKCKAGAEYWIYVGNVVANDVYPDGMNVEVIPTAFGLLQNFAGYYTIDADGNAYIRKTTNYEGRVFFDYILREIGTAYTTGRVATVFIDIGGTSVFAKIVQTNIVTTSDTHPLEPNRTIFTTTSKYWVYFYADSAGTIALDVTGRGVSLNVRRITDTTVYNQAASANNQLPSQYLDYVLTGTGTSMLLFDGVTKSRVKAESPDVLAPRDLLTETKQWVLQAGTTYKAI